MRALVRGIGGLGQPSPVRSLNEASLQRISRYENDRDALREPLQLDRAFGVGHEQDLDVLLE